MLVTNFSLITNSRVAMIEAFWILRVFGSFISSSATKTILTISFVFLESHPGNALCLQVHYQQGNQVGSTKHFDCRPDISAVLNDLLAESEMTKLFQNMHSPARKIGPNFPNFPRTIFKETKILVNQMRWITVQQQENLQYKWTLRTKLMKNNISRCVQFKSQLP